MPGAVAAPLHAVLVLSLCEYYIKITNAQRKTCLGYRGGVVMGVLWYLLGIMEVEG